MESTPKLDKLKQDLEVLVTNKMSSLLSSSIETPQMDLEREIESNFHDEALQLSLAGNSNFNPLYKKQFLSMIALAFLAYAAGKVKSVIQNQINESASDMMKRLITQENVTWSFPASYGTPTYRFDPKEQDSLEIYAVILGGSFNSNFMTYGSYFLDLADDETVVLDILQCTPSGYKHVDDLQYSYDNVTKEINYSFKSRPNFIYQVSVSVKDNASTVVRRSKSEIVSFGLLWFHSCFNTTKDMRSGHVTSLPEIPAVVHDIIRFKEYKPDDLTNVLVGHCENLIWEGVQNNSILPRYNKQDLSLSNEYSIPHHPRMGNPISNGWNKVLIDPYSTCIARVQYEYTVSSPIITLCSYNQKIELVTLRDDYLNGFIFRIRLDKPSSESTYKADLINLISESYHYCKVCMKFFLRVSRVNDVYIARVYRRIAPFRIMGSSDFNRDPFDGFKDFQITDKHINLVGNFVDTFNWSRPNVLPVTEREVYNSITFNTPNHICEVTFMYNPFSTPQIPYVPNDISFLSTSFATIIKISSEQLFLPQNVFTAMERAPSIEENWLMQQLSYTEPTSVESDPQDYFYTGPTNSYDIIKSIDAYPPAYDKNVLHAVEPYFVDYTLPPRFKFLFYDIDILKLRKYFCNVNGLLTIPLQGPLKDSHFEYDLTTLDTNQYLFNGNKVTKQYIDSFRLSEIWPVASSSDDIKSVYQYENFILYRGTRQNNSYHINAVRSYAQGYFNTDSVFSGIPQPSNPNAIEEEGWYFVFSEREFQNEYIQKPAQTRIIFKSATTGLQAHYIVLPDAFVENNDSIDCVKHFLSTGGMFFYGSFYRYVGGSTIITIPLDHRYAYHSVPSLHDRPLLRSFHTSKVNADTNAAVRNLCREPEQMHQGNIIAGSDVETFWNSHRSLFLDPRLEFMEFAVL